MPVSSQAASIAALSHYRASYFLLTQKKVTKEKNSPQRCVGQHGAAVRCPALKGPTSNATATATAAAEATAPAKSKALWRHLLTFDSTAAWQLS